MVTQKKVTQFRQIFIPPHQPLMEWTLPEFKEYLWNISHAPHDCKPYMRMLVTPEIAKWVLDNRNQSNRDINKALLKRMVLDMEKGKFRFIHQGIAFKRNGGLADGQHRFSAVAETGKSVTMLTMFNLDLPDLMAIDEASRSDVDIWNLLFSQTLDRLPKGTQSVFRPFFYPMGVYFKELPKKDRLAHVLHYRESLIWAAKNIVGTHDGQAPIKGAFARAHAAGLDPDKMLECWNLFKTASLMTGRDQTGTLVHNFRTHLKGGDSEKRIEGFGDEYYNSRYPHMVLKCQCMEVLIYYYVKGKIHQLRSLKTGVDRLRDGKLYTVPKMTSEEVEECLQVLEEKAEDPGFLYTGMEEYQDREAPIFKNQ